MGAPPLLGCGGCCAAAAAAAGGAAPKGMGGCWVGFSEEEDKLRESGDIFFAAVEEKQN